MCCSSAKMDGWMTYMYLYLHMHSMCLPSTDVFVCVLGGVWMGRGRATGTIGMHACMRACDLSTYRSVPLSTLHYPCTTYYYYYHGYCHYKLPLPFAITICYYPAAQYRVVACGRVLCVDQVVTYSAVLHVTPGTRIHAQGTHTYLDIYKVQTDTWGQTQSLTIQVHV